MAQSDRKVHRRNYRPAAPVSSHRLFPAMVALWFAALFGIGSMILPASLYDALADQSDLGAAMPAAAAPFGPTAKLVITLLATGAGAVLGLGLARRVAGSQGADPIRRREFATPAAPATVERVSEPRKPFLVHEDLADCDLRPEQPAEDLTADTTPRRRALAMEEPEGPSEWFHPNLPFSHIADLDDEPIDGSQPFVAETLDLGNFAMAEAVEPEIFEKAPLKHMAQPEPHAPEDAVGLGAPDWLEEEPLEAVAPGPVAHQASAGPVEEQELSQLGLAELTLRLDHAIRTRIAQDKEASAVSGPLIADAPVAEDGGLQSYFGNTTPQPVAGEPETVAEVPSEFAPAATEPCLAAPLAPRPMPAALRPVSFSDSMEAEEEPVLHRGIRRDPAPTDQRQVFGSPVAFAGPDAIEPEEADETAEENFGSLTEMANPFRSGSGFVRIEEAEAESDSIEPAVVFPAQKARRIAAVAAPAEPESPTPQPAQSAASGFLRRSDSAVQTVTQAFAKEEPIGPVSAMMTDPAETERALRLALATLQRMSGAA